MVTKRFSPLVVASIIAGSTLIALLGSQSQSLAREVCRDIPLVGRRCAWVPVADPNNGGDGGSTADLLPSRPTRVTICNRISSTATFFLNSELKSMAGGNCGGYTLPAGSTFKTSYSKNGQRIQVLVNLEGVTYDLVKHPSGDIELRRR